MAITNKLTAETVTDGQIRALRSKAIAAGDDAQVRVCDCAFAGCPGRFGRARLDCRQTCADAINDAATQGG